MEREYGDQPARLLWKCCLCFQYSGRGLSVSLGRLYGQRTWSYSKQESHFYILFTLGVFALFWIPRPWLSLHGPDSWIPGEVMASLQSEVTLQLWRQREVVRNTVLLSFGWFLHALEGDDWCVLRDRKAVLYVNAYKKCIVFFFGRRHAEMSLQTHWQSSW